MGQLFFACEACNGTSDGAPLCAQCAADLATVRHPASGVRVRAATVLDDLAEQAGALTARCLAGQESPAVCIAAAAQLRALAERVAKRDPVLAATCEACALEIETKLTSAATERAS